MGGVTFLVLFQVYKSWIFVEHGNDLGMNDVLQSGIEGR